MRRPNHAQNDKTSSDNVVAYGAALLSSRDECDQCIRHEVKKKRLSITTADISFNISESQPTMAVADDFTHLRMVLNTVYSQSIVDDNSLAKDSITHNGEMSQRRYVA